MHYAHNVGLGAFIKICIFEHLYTISYTDIRIQLIYALYQTRKNVVKMTKGREQNDSDCVHTMPAHFENDEKCDGRKI